MHKDAIKKIVSMNPNKQRIAIAEACGWQRVKSYDEAMPEGSWVRPGLTDFDES
jgi:hypothetical protein